MVNGQWLLMTSDLKHVIPLDLNDEKIDLVQAQVDAMASYQQHQGPMVPEEFRDKYCFIFGGEVLASADTMEELMTKESQFCNLAYSVYCPNQVQ